MCGIVHRLRRPKKLASAGNNLWSRKVSYSEILSAYEADEIDFMCALELANCHSLIELYENAAEENGAILIRKSVALFNQAA